jgi:DNA-binding CsgD family transcriptional regulator
VALEDGDLDEAARLLACFQDHPAPTPCSAAAGLWVEGQLAEHRHGPDRACQILAPIYDDPARYRRLLLEEPGAGPWLVRSAIEAGDVQAAERVAEHAELLARANADFDLVVAAASHARALLQRDTDTLERLGIEHRHPASRAAACEDAGDLLARGGHRGPARVQLERALAAFEHLTARRAEARVRQRLNDLGSGRRRSRHGPQPVSGWGSLTEAERRVADLVAQGLSNPQAAQRLFLSRHTVDFHLRQVFRKLGIGSRVELTRLALQRDIKAPSAGPEGVFV